MATIDFLTGTPDAYKRQFSNAMDELASLKRSNDRQSQLINQAMNSIIGLSVLRNQDRAAEWVASLPRFWRQAGDVLASHRVELAGYRAEMETAFWQRTSRDWVQGSLRRSGFEILRTDVEPASVQIIRDDFLEIDEELPEIATQVPRLQTGSIPKGMPQSHWWWTLPSADPDEDFEGY